MNDINIDVVDVDASEISNEFILRGIRKTGKKVHKIYNDKNIAEFEFDAISLVAVELTLSIVVGEIEAVYKTYENTEFIKKIIEKETKKTTRRKTE